MIYQNDRFIFPKDETDCFSEHDKKIKNQMMKELLPENGDVIIISSSDDTFVAEISAKNSALWTMATT